MTHSCSALFARVLSVLLLTSVLAMGFPALGAHAEPLNDVRAAASVIQTAPLGSVDTTVTRGAASLTPDTFAILAGAPYRFTARVDTGGAPDSVQMRFKLFSPTGRMMIQKTNIDSDVKDGQSTVVFERETTDLGLVPGSYPVQLEVRVSQDGAITDKTLDSELLVYAAEAAQVPLVLALRITGQPLSDAQGRFVTDPSQYTRARDDARAIAMWVIARPGAHVTLAISPVLLEEWRRISEGYVFTGPEGRVSVAVDDAVPLAYAEALTQIERALMTGRLELATLGYADPDLSQLTEHDLTSDVGPQYSQGTSAIFASLQTTASAGTIPAGGCVPPQAVDPLTREGIRYAIVDQQCARSGTSAAASGAYAIKDSPLIVLVADRRADRALAEGDWNGLARAVFRRVLTNSTAPLVVRGDIGPGGLSVDTLSQTVDAVLGQAWIRTARGDEFASPRPKRVVRLTRKEELPQAPLGYWSEVRNGRRWANALMAAVPNSRQAQMAYIDSLIAECSAWAGPEGDWDLSDRGRAYASHAARLARSVLDPISLKVSAITLAGSDGEVPVIISNDSDTELSLTLVVEPSGGVRVTGKKTRTMQVLPKDNFIEIPVDLQESLSGKLTVKVISGDTVIDQQTVAIAASYLDRLVMIAAVTLVLGTLLIFVIRRVRAAERLAEQNKSADGS